MSNTGNLQKLYIGIFGRVNVGKSSFFNLMLGQERAIVSDKKGTTTDPVRKAIELHDIGPCLLIDTAGIDDDNDLGQKRIDKTMDVADEVDIAIILLENNDDLSYEKKLRDRFIRNKTPMIFILAKSDLLSEVEQTRDRISKALQDEVYVLDENLIKARQLITTIIKDKMPADFYVAKLFDGYDIENKNVILVMPQDKQAPMGRLILPQSTAIRELLEKSANAICCLPENFKNLLDILKFKPDLIVADSSALGIIKPYVKDLPLTTFSVLFAGFKGDVDVFKKGAQSIDNLKDNDNILIAEACTHDPVMEGDIGRVKIPNMLMKTLGIKLNVDISAGNDFPNDLSRYALIIQCGGCMVNKRNIMQRVKKAGNYGVPITNYGVLLAKLNGVKLS